MPNPQLPSLARQYRLTFSALHQCRNHGWAGVGFWADPWTMKNADIHLCTMTNGSWEILDAYALDVGPPTSDVTLPGGTYDLFDTSASWENGVTTCQFSRFLSCSLAQRETHLLTDTTVSYAIVI